MKGVCVFHYTLIQSLELVKEVYTIGGIQTYRARLTLDMHTLRSNLFKISDLKRSTTEALFPTIVAL